MNVCVFCGSGTGKNPIYSSTAKSLGELLAGYGHTLVYGGGNIGLMGILADAVLGSGGKVIGVIPDFLMDREVGHRALTQLEVVSSMHERKRRMADLSDAFIVLPGGWGTLDETAEMLTWKQLGLIRQPLGIINTNNFFQPMLNQMQHMVNEGFLKQENLDSVTIVESPNQLLQLMLLTRG